MPTPEENVSWLVAYVRGADAKIDAAGGTTGISAEQFDAYDDETVFYYDRKTYRGRAGIQEFIDLLAPFDIEFGEIIDVFGNEKRVTLVIEESLQRKSDGVRCAYIRTATYLIEGGVIKECWIIDAPPQELAAYLAESVG